MKQQMAAMGLVVLASSGCTPAMPGPIVKAVALPTQESGSAAEIESDAADRAWDSEEPRVIKRDWDVELGVFDDDGNSRWCNQEPTCSVKPREHVFVRDGRHLDKPGFVNWLNREGVTFRFDDDATQRESLMKAAARKLQRVGLMTETTDADLMQVVSAMPRLRELGRTPE